LDDLILALTLVLCGRATGASNLTRQRHREALGRAFLALESARTGLDTTGHGLEFAAADLRNAVAALESLIGRVGVEDYLGEIFSSFCIGK